MNNKRNRWILIGTLLLVTLLVSGFVLMQPTAKDLLVQSIENSKTITDGHATVSIIMDTIEDSETAMIEVWARHGDEDKGAFRIEVLETTKAEAQNAVIVSDGETLWAYSPAENKVFIGTPEDAKAMMADNEFFAEHLEESKAYKEGDKEEFQDKDLEKPENADEAVDKLFEYFAVSRSGSDEISGEPAEKLKLEPIAEQMPDEYVAVGGILNLWLSQNSSLPVAFEYTGGALGEISVTVLDYEINQGIDEALFSFEVPENAERVTFEDLEPKELTLAEVENDSTTNFVTPATTPEGAKLVDILEIRGVVVQRYALPDGGSFTIAQGSLDELPDEMLDRSPEGKDVPLRGASATLTVSDDGTQAMLTWVEEDLFLAVSGDITPEQAIKVAESLN